MAFAQNLNHPAIEALECPFANFISNQPSKAREHFYALREAKPDLVGFALFDRLTVKLNDEPSSVQRMLKRREIENYLLDIDTLRHWAKDEGVRLEGELFANSWETLMSELIDQVDEARKTLGMTDSSSPDIKATDEFLDPVFKKFYESKGLPVLMRKTDYHILVPYFPNERIDPEIVDVLDQIVSVASQANPIR